MRGRAILLDDEDDVAEEREVEDVNAEGDADEASLDEYEEGQDEYEKDGFIVDVVDEEESRADIDKERQKKRKRKKRESEKSYLLDEDDYELLQDNNAQGFQQLKAGSTKFKRLKKAGRDSEQGKASGFSDVEALDETGWSGGTEEEKLNRSLFGDDEAPLEDIAEEEEQPEENDDDGDVGDEDEMADFIVHDGEEFDEAGAPVRHKKPKRKKTRQAPGVSSTALQEAHEIFGDVEDLLDRRKRSLDKGDRFDESGKWKEKRLEDEFEPFVLTQKYITEKDNRIREIDVPERIQLSEESTGPPPTDVLSLEEESTWVYNQLYSNMVSSLPGMKKLEVSNEDGLDISRNISKEDILRFLEMLHVQKYDIPYIAMYRKEACPTLLREPVQDGVESGEGDNADKKPRIKWHKVLWLIKDLDRKWLLLQKRKSALLLYYSKRYKEETQRIYDETRLSLNQQLFESIIKSLKTAEIEREVDDVDSKFNLHFPPGEVGIEGKFKRPRRKTLYSACSKAGLWEVASKFGFNSERFGLLWTSEIMTEIDYLDYVKDTPEEIASNFRSAMFETSHAVLKGARHMAAVEICHEPCVRKKVRNIYMENAVVSTSPTPSGNVAIDPFHQFAGVKWLCEKPLVKFEDDQWLLIQKAEEKKLLIVTIKLPADKLDDLTKAASEYYLSDGVSKSAQLWNEQRKLILQDAFNFLLPSMEKEARSLLTARAKNWLLMEYGKRLWNKVSVAPYQWEESDSASYDKAAPRVMACCWGPGKPSTAFVMLDSSGEVLDVLYAGSLSLKSQNVNDQQRKKNDQQRVLKFMTNHQPQVVVLGAVNLSCTRLKDDIYEIICKMVEEYPRDVSQGMDNLVVVYGDESLPRLYENSQVSSDQLPDRPGIVKRAAALGRYLQNPLAMVATLCGPAREILSWKLSPLGHFLTPDEKYEMLEQVMVDATNQVGIDINLAISHEWLFAPLQFVAGFGPRKAASLQRALVRAGAIFSRKELTRNGLKKKVFINAIGFLRVHRAGLASTSSHVIHMLDDTRIHPESYGIATEMARDVYKHEVEVDDESNDLDEEMQELAIEHVRENPKMLKTLDLEEYATSKNCADKLQTFTDIKMELLHGFQDWRNPYQELSQDEEFYIISGETEETLAEGCLVQATVRRVQPQRALCVLESGLSGMLQLEDFSDDPIDNLTEHLNEGEILTCKITSIQKHKYLVFLTCKERELKSNYYQNSCSRDPYYQEEPSSLQREQEKACKEELAKKHVKPRMIVHPRFQNITADEAVELLSDKDAGEAIIRPSSRGPSFLTLTLKVFDGVYAHKDIIEGGKEHTDITSLLRLGKTLKIGHDTFEDLDEVMDRYVDPLVTHLKAMLSYRKFKKGSKAEIDDLLRIEKLENPMRIVFCFGICHEHPGTCILSYIRSTNLRHEYIGLYPKGFRFRKKDFEDIEHLVAYFQRHINDPPPGSAPSIRSVAAMVPMKSPATGGSSGEVSVRSGWGGSTTSNDGGWRGHSNSDGGRSSTPGSRSGRNDYRNGSGQYEHPSGVPRPYGGRGRGRGRGHDSYNGRGNDSSNERLDSGYGSTWSSGSKDGNDDWNNFPGSKVENSPGREAVPGGWGSGGGSGGTGGWAGESGSGTGGWGGATSGGGTISGSDFRNSGWADGSKKSGSAQPGGNGWCGSGSGGTGGGGSGNTGGWAGESGGGAGGWGGTMDSGADVRNSGWGDGSKQSDSALPGANSWSGSGSGGTGGGGDRYEHPSRVPRPYGGGGRGRGRGRGSYNGRGNDSSDERVDTGSSKDGNDSWNKFPDSKVQNLPGRESFPGSWGSGGGGSGGAGGWAGESGGGGDAGGGWGGATDGGGKMDSGSDITNSGWGHGSKKTGSAGGNGWCGSGSGGTGCGGSGGTGGWAGKSGGGGGATAGGWGGTMDSGADVINSGWGDGSKKSDSALPGANSWSGSGSGGTGGVGDRYERPSKVPRPYGGGGHGRGRGRRRGRGSYNGRGNDSSEERLDSGSSKDGNDGWNKFSDSKVQNSPSRAAFPGRWGSGGGSGGAGGWAGESGGGGAAGGGWGGATDDGGKMDSGSDVRNSGWGDGSKKSGSAQPGANSWSGSGSGGWTGGSGGGGGGW